MGFVLHRRHFNLNFRKTIDDDGIYLYIYTDPVTVYETSNFMFVLIDKIFYLIKSFYINIAVHDRALVPFSSKNTYNWCDGCSD